MCFLKVAVHMSVAESVDAALLGTPMPVQVMDGAPKIGELPHQWLNSMFYYT